MLSAVSPHTASVCILPVLCACCPSLTPALLPCLSPARYTQLPPAYPSCPALRWLPCHWSVMCIRMILGQAMTIHGQTTMMHWGGWAGRAGCHQALPPSAHHPFPHMGWWWAIRYSYLPSHAARHHHTYVPTTTCATNTAVLVCAVIRM